MPPAPLNPPPSPHQARGAICMGKGMCMHHLKELRKQSYLSRVTGGRDRRHFSRSSMSLAVHEERGREELFLPVGVVAG